MPETRVRFSFEERKNTRCAGYSIICYVHARTGYSGTAVRGSWNTKRVRHSFSLLSHSHSFSLSLSPTIHRTNTHTRDKGIFSPVSKRNNDTTQWSKAGKADERVGFDCSNRERRSSLSLKRCRSHVKFKNDGNKNHHPTYSKTFYKT